MRFVPKIMENLGLFAAFAKLFIWGLKVIIDSALNLDAHVKSLIHSLYKMFQDYFSCLHSSIIHLSKQNLLGSSAG